MTLFLGIVVVPLLTKFISGSVFDEDNIRTHLTLLAIIVISIVGGIFSYKTDAMLLLMFFVSCGAVALSIKAALEWEIEKHDDWS